MVTLLTSRSASDHLGFFLCLTRGQVSLEAPNSPLSRVAADPMAALNFSIDVCFDYA